MSRDLPPQGVEEAASELRVLPGVRAVVWGMPSRRGVWREDERALGVRVCSKRPLNPVHEVPRTLGPHRTDVVGVERIRGHALDPADTLRARGRGGGWRGPVTVAAVAAERPIVLVTAHGTLPVDSTGRMVRQYRATGAALDARGDDGTRAWQGALVAGALTSSLDWMVADFGGAPTTAVHPLLGVSPPFAVASPPPVGARVRYWSRFAGAGAAVRGVVTGAVVGGPLAVALPDGTGHGYVGAFEVAPRGAPRFSERGDSGSIVFDDFGRAVGMVIAGSELGAVSYVLSLAATRPALVNAGFPDFFS